MKFFFLNVLFFQRNLINTFNLETYPIKLKKKLKSLVLAIIISVVTITNFDINQFRLNLLKVMYSNF